MVPPLIAASAAAAAIVSGLLLLGWLVRDIARRSAERRRGALAAIDDGRAPSLRSPRYRLSGRPDSIRRLPDGRSIAVERKSRPSPRAAPPSSHRVQVHAYSLLLEESTGRSPPYGLLVYGDGGEFRVPWDARGRAEVLGVRDAVARPYQGEARPSAARCRRCPWRPHCDARAA